MQNPKQKTGIKQKRELKGLTYVRMALQKDIPEVFSRITKIDIPCDDDWWKNRKKNERSLKLYYFKLKFYHIVKIASSDLSYLS